MRTMKLAVALFSTLVYNQALSKRVDNHLTSAQASGARNAAVLDKRLSLRTTTSERGKVHQSELQRVVINVAPFRQSAAVPPAPFAPTRSNTAPLKVALESGATFLEEQLSAGQQQDNIKAPLLPIILVLCSVFVLSVVACVMRSSEKSNASETDWSSMFAWSPTAAAGARAETQKEVEMFLRGVELFKSLPVESVAALAKAGIFRHFAAREPIVKQGDEGSEFFMIKVGIANVEIDGKTVATLNPRDYFGENSLVCSELQDATIVGQTGIEAFTITRKQFFNLGLNEQLEFPKRMAIAQGTDTDVHIEPPVPKTVEEEKLIIDALRANKNLAFMRLTENSMKEMAAVAWKVDVASDTEIITQGDTKAAYFYIVQQGSFLVSVVEKSIPQSGTSDSSRTKISGLSKIVEAQASYTISSGGSFGALALLYNAPRAATVTAKEPSAVWVIARPHFKDVVLKAAEEHVGKYVQYLNNVELTQHLPEQQKVKIAKALGEMTFKKGDVPIKEGEKGDMLYILIEGTVDITKNGVSLFPNQDYPTASADKAISFGKGALESNENCRAASVEILSEKARCLVLDKISYDILLGKYSPHRNTSKFGQIQFKDLNRLAILGRGGFGTVELVEHATNKMTYALKGQSKGFIVGKGLERYVVSEKNVQLMCESPFIIKLIETFNDGDSLYMLLELALGGEITDVYNKKGFWGNHGLAKYYAAGIVFALEHLHSKKIIHRDLKLENMMLTHKGYVKLTDMGLAKFVVGKTFTVCGTPDYMAPEVIKSRGTTSAADWWALGIVIFQLLAGYPPFTAMVPLGIFLNIYKGIESVRFSHACRGDVRELIYGLCQEEPHERLPMKQGASENIKDHTWYMYFDWDAMFNLTMEPPYVPRVRSNKDMANFCDASSTAPHVVYRDPGTGWDKDFATST